MAEQAGNGDDAKSLRISIARRKQHAAIAVSVAVFLSYSAFVALMSFAPTWLAQPVGASGSISLGIVLVLVMIPGYLLVAAVYAVWANALDRTLQSPRDAAAEAQ